MSGHLRGDTLLTADHLAKVDRVLDAARVCEQMWASTDSTLRFFCPEVRALGESVRALDAPRERYTVENVVYPCKQSGEVEQRVCDEVAGVRFTVIGVQGTASAVARALNAAERAK